MRTVAARGLAAWDVARPEASPMTSEGERARRRRKAPRRPEEAEAGLERVTTEVRWILPADAGAALAGLHRDRPVEERVDTYVVPAERSRWSVKRRGPTGLLEAKRRIGPVEVLELHGVALGRVQRWRKVLAAEHPEGVAVDVRKRRWRRQGVEVVWLELDGGVEAWSVGVRVVGRRMGELRRRCDAALVGTPVHELLVPARSCSYPEWLRSQVQGTPPEGSS
jgi:hypothetical protein